MNATDTELTAFMEGLAPRARLMGIDLGTKTIGLALSDVERRIATPLETIKRVKFTPDVRADQGSGRALRGRRPRRRPAAQHGRHRGPPLAGDAGLRAQPQPP